MYNEHFGLTQAPFRITPDTGLFYTGGGRGDVLDALVYAVTSGEGIVKVVGEVGTGKTMLCRMLEERLPDNVQIAYLANPSLTPEDILHAVALELGLDLEPGAARLQVMHRLQQALLERHAQNRRVVALVEEAQSMPVDTLEEIRLLSNLETKNEKLLQIILFGQPELDDNLARPEIRQLRERITHSFQLKPLGVDEIKDYVAFRLRASGYRGRDAFTRDAYRVMSRASEGLTRRVNIIADKAMLAAFAEDTHDVSARHVKVAIQDSEFGASRRPARASRPILALAGVAAAAAVLAGGVGWYAGTRLAGAPADVDALAMGGTDGPTSRVPQGNAADPRDDLVRAPQAEREDPVLASAASASGAGASAGVTVAMAAKPAVAAPQAAPRENESRPVPPAREPDREDAVVTAPVSTPASGIPAGSGSGEREREVDPPVAARAVAAAVEPEAVRATVLLKKARQVAALSRTTPADVATSATPQPASGPSGAPAGQPQESEPDVAAPVGRSAASPAAGSVAVARREPEPVVPVAPPPSAEKRRPRPGTLVDQRLEDTREWLRQVDGKHYSIQLLATDATQRGNLEAFLKRRDRAGHLDKVFVYRTRINSRLWYGVLFGEFASFSEAREALDALPGELTRHQPFIRNIRDISVLG